MHTYFILHKNVDGRLSLFSILSPAGAAFLSAYSLDPLFVPVGFEGPPPGTSLIAPFSRCCFSSSLFFS